MTKWISVLDYSRKHNINRSKLYFQMWRGIAKFEWRKKEIMKEYYQIKDE